VGAKPITADVKRYFAILMAQDPSQRGVNFTVSCEKDSIDSHTKIKWRRGSGTSEFSGSAVYFRRIKLWVKK